MMWLDVAQGYGITLGAQMSFRTVLDLSKICFGLILVELSFFACLGFEFGVRRERVPVVCGDKRSWCPSVTLFQEIHFIHTPGLLFRHCA